MDIFELLLRNVDKPGGKNGNAKNVNCNDLFEAAKEYQIRTLAFNCAVNMISSYISQCEIRTYKNGKEVREREYYTWNVEPNANQNKTAFLNKLVYQLMLNNEALIIEAGNDNSLVVADSFTIPELLPVKQNVYQSVTVGDFTYTKTFREKDVIHIKLHDSNIKEITDGLYQSYYRLVAAAMDNFEWNAGKHWKVHVDSVAEGKEGFLDEFNEIISKQLKPFFNSNSSILPEFDGYTFTDTSESRTTRSASGETTDIRNLIGDIFDFTAQGFGIPPVLLKGEVENTEGAEKRFYTRCDGIIKQISEEITRKRCGYEGWKTGTYIIFDSSAVMHFDIFDSAAKVEKLVGSGMFSINEIRRAANQPLINEPWADEHFLTKNIGDLSGGLVLET